MPNTAPSVAPATVPEYSTLMPRFSPPLMPLTTRSGLRAELGERQLHAIGRAAFHGPAAPPLAVEHFLRHERAEERDRVPYAALLDRRRDDAHVAQPLQRTLHRRQAGRVNAVVVRQQYLHRCCDSAFTIRVCRSVSNALSRAQHTRIAVPAQLPPVHSHTAAILHRLEFTAKNAIAVQD